MNEIDDDDDDDIVFVGLCRTCEIFGARALVLDSLHHISDKHFQSLSVSAELWLPLIEVMCANFALRLIPDLTNCVKKKKHKKFMDVDLY